MGANPAGTSSPYVSPSFSVFFFLNDIFAKWKLLHKINKNTITYAWRNFPHIDYLNTDMLSLQESSDKLGLRSNE